MAELKNIRIAVSGIYDYALEELPTLRLPLPGQGAPEWAEKKCVYKVYRPAFVLAAACGKFKMLPLTHHHPSTPVDGRNFRKLAVGYTGENPFVDWIKDTDEVGIRSTVMIYDDEALDAYERGEIQLSPGYVASFEWQRGKAPDGQEYDIVMKEIADVNHLALLPAGRGGEYAVVMDGRKREPSVFKLAKLGTETRDSRKIYQTGETNKAALRWTVNDDGTLTPEDKPSTDSLKKTLWPAPHAQTQQQDSALNYDTEPDSKFLSDSAGGDCSKGLCDSLHDVFISGKERNDDEMKIACPEATDSSIGRSANGVGGHPRRQAGNFEYILTHNDGSVKDEKKAGVLRETASDDGTVHDERAADTTRVVSLNITDEARKVKPAFKMKKEKATDTRAHAGSFTSDTVRPENLFDTEIVIHAAPQVKSVFELARTNDGAPYGNDNASKDHVNKEEAEAAKKRVFGKEFKGYSGAEAVEKLLQEKQGFIQGAFSRKDIGDIDVVYGEVTDPKTHKGYGLAHIFDKHPEITPKTISEIINKGTLEKTHNGYNLTFGRYRAGINNGYKENGKYVTTDNWIVTSFKINREKATGAIAYAADFTSDTDRPENLFDTEIIIHAAPKVKSVFEIAAGSVFDRAGMQ